VGLIRGCGALRRSMDVARKRAEAAISAIAPLQPSAWKDAMLDLASYSVSRDH